MDQETKDKIKALKILKRKVFWSFHFIGMCYEIGGLNKKYRIILVKYLRENKPRNTDKTYWWICGEKKPRLKWLKEEITKLKQN